MSNHIYDAQAIQECGIIVHDGGAIMKNVVEVDLETRMYKQNIPPHGVVESDGPAQNIICKVLRLPQPEAH